jgi:hypothetical protein
LLWLFAAPLLLLMLRWTKGLFGQVLHPVSVWMTLALALLGPLLYVAARLAVVYYRYHPRRSSTLALYDAELRAHDRLVTADEFLNDAAGIEGGHGHSYGFKQAALADADQYARSALGAALSPLSLRQWKIRPVSWLGIPAVLLVMGLLYSGLDGTQLAARSNDQALAAALEASVSPKASEEQREAARKRVRKLEQQKRELQLAMIEKEEALVSESRKSRNEKGAAGQPNSGTAAMARSRSNSKDAAGDPSSQKNSSKPKKPEEEKPEEKDDKEDKNRKNKKEEQKSTQTMMSATSGEGKLSMTHSSPSEFDLPEREDKAGAGTKQENSDAESEDEDEQEKTNTAEKPSLSQKMNAMNRDGSNSVPFTSEGRKLFSSPEFGRANGGEPTKKSRGVPSMVLGVPVPDRVIGMVHPGRSKVTQEDAKPTQESSQMLQAQLRLARADAIGRIAHPGLPGWMRRLVADYFVTLRQQAIADPGEGYR